MHRAGKLILQQRMNGASIRDKRKLYSRLFRNGLPSWVPKLCNNAAT